MIAPRAQRLNNSRSPSGLEFSSENENFKRTLFETSDMCASWTRVCKRWFQMVVRVGSAEQTPRPQFNLKLTTALPQVHLFSPLCLPHFNPCSAGNLEPRFGNHLLQTLGGLESESLNLGTHTGVLQEGLRGPKSREN